MNEEIDIQKQGKDLMIGFNPKFLIDALRVIDDEEVDLYMVNPKAPCLSRMQRKLYLPDPSRELYNSCLNLRTEVK